MWLTQNSGKLNQTGFIAPVVIVQVDLYSSMHAKRSKRPRTYGGWISVAGQDYAFGTKDCLSILRVRERMILFYIHTQYQRFITAGVYLRFRTFLVQIPAIFCMC